VRAFREGFSEVFPVKDLACFTADELVLVFGNSTEDWSLQSKGLCASFKSDLTLSIALHDSIRADHGFSMDSRIVNDLLAILSDFDKPQQRLFLSFATGSPRLPVGGFKSLHPPLTVVRKPPESGHSPDDYLPSVMTCQNYVRAALSCVKHN
jgi:E3 ubiquitin-protein ligase TRIP12